MRLKIIIPIVSVIVILIITILFLDVIFSNDKDKLMLIGYSKYTQKWIDIKNGAISAGEKNGVDVGAIACDSKQDTTDQIEMIKNALSEDIDTILLMPTNLSLLEEVIQDIRRSKIKLIILDEPVEGDYNFVGSAMKDIGYNMARDLDSTNKDRQIDVVCIYTFDDNGKSLLGYNGFIDYANTHDSINIISESVSAIDINIAAAIVKSIIIKNKADYIVCFDETITEGAAQSLIELLKEYDVSIADTNVKIAGFGDIVNCSKYLEDEIITMLAVQNYYGIGYIAVNNYRDMDEKETIVKYVIVHKSDFDKKEYQQILFDFAN